MKIALLCPSRGRPVRCAQMIDSALDCASNADRVIPYVMVDEDDPALSQYEALREKAVLIVNKTKGRSGPALLNELALLSTEELLFVGSDDILFRTSSWDALLQSAFERYPDQLLVAYTNDGLDRDKCTHFAVSRRWVELAGGLTPDFEHFYVDEYVMTIGKAIGRTVYLREIVTEHMHYKWGKSQEDETYRIKRGNGMSRRDKARMQQLMPQVGEIAARLRTAMVAP